MYDYNILLDEIKNNMNIEKRLFLTNFIQNEKNNILELINEKTIYKYNILKKFIIYSIIKFNKDYNEEKIIKIFNHAFTFEHANIEIELKDRLLIK